jgi:plastocyanin
MIRRFLVATVTAAGLAAVACGGGSGTGSTSSTPTPKPTAQTVSFTESEFKIDTASTSLKAGDYMFSVKNIGSFPHDLHIATPDGTEIAKSDLLQAGMSGTFQVTLKAGSYTMWCAVDSHKARGMQGTLTVT